MIKWCVNRACLEGVFFLPNPFGTLVLGMTELSPRASWQMSDCSVFISVFTAGQSNCQRAQNSVQSKRTICITYKNHFVRWETIAS